MDALREELERKRKQKAEQFGARKFVKRSEIEAKALEELRKQEQEERERRQKRQVKESASSADDENASKPQALGAKDNEDDSLEKMVLPRAEVIRRLRLLKHPITLFGEDDEARLARLKALLKAGVTIDVTDEMMEGQKNDFLRDLIQLKRTEKQLQRQQQKREEKKERAPGPDVPGEEGNGQAEESLSETGEDDATDAKIMKANFGELSPEDKILVFFKRLCREWKQEVDEMVDADKRTNQGKKTIVTFQQCRRYLDPLLDSCRRRTLPDDILEALSTMVSLCLQRDYLAAMDVYIRLSIGNAPWPIGVTMVGIHERSAREKIHTSSVAHIMNDETTRKYLQSVKRLMTFCQRKYPSAPSKSVEFNSLANGSDLQSLLMEEVKAKKVGTGAFERLQLMAATHAD